MPPAPSDQSHDRLTLDHFARRVMSGDDRRLSATLLRAALAAAEPFYSGVAAARNRMFDSGIKATRSLPRPTISVGNITTGGTGKTPVVRWLAEQLRDDGWGVAILSRGYGSKPGTLGDEQLMLDRALNGPAERHRVTLVAHPDRLRGARDALRLRPETDVFLLDDGFQHRRAGRDLDVVLVSATNPFGYGRVLPRGMLREPLGGLRRAGAFIITHADQATPEELRSVEQTLRRYNAAAPVYQAAHAHASLRTNEPPSERPPEALRDKKWFAFCGIGDPATFLRQLQAAGGTHVGHRWFGDHHRYTPDDLAALRREAAAAGADVMLTTEKDWAKIAGLGAAEVSGAPPVWRVGMEIRFKGDDGERLLGQVKDVLRQRPR